MSLNVEVWLFEKREIQEQSGCDDKLFRYALGINGSGMLVGFGPAGKVQSLPLESVAQYRRVVPISVPKELGKALRDFHEAESAASDALRRVLNEVIQPV